MNKKRTTSKPLGLEDRWREPTRNRNGPVQAAGLRPFKTPECGAGVELAIKRGWLELNESGTFVKFSPEPLGS